MQWKRTWKQIPKLFNYLVISFLRLEFFFALLMAKKLEIHTMIYKKSCGTFCIREKVSIFRFLRVHRYLQFALYRFEY